MGHEENQYVEKKIADKISYTLKKQKERNNSAIIQMIGKKQLKDRVTITHPFLQEA